jgi:phosphatidate cytidylyltransferase
MMQRLQSALPLLLLVAFAFFLPGSYGSLFFLAFAFGMLFLGCRELFTMLNLAHGKLFSNLAFICGGGFIIGAMFPAVVQQYLIDTLMLALFCTSAFAVVMRHGPSIQNVHSLLVSIGVFLYFCWSLGFIPKIYFMDSNGHGRLLLLYMIAITKLADTGAYFAGTLTAKRPKGNHKLSKVISPKKSWEGLIGGTVTSLAASVGCYYWGVKALSINGQTPIGLVDAIIFGVIASLLGLAGDMAESAIKRAANVKDSGQLPGIGGVLDTLDSLIPMGPVFYAFLVLRTAL